MTKRVGGKSTTILETYTGIKAEQVIAPATSIRVAATRQNNWSTLIQAHPDNVADIHVGDGLLQPVQLSAGESITIATDAYEVFIRSEPGNQVANILMLL